MFESLFLINARRLFATGEYTIENYNAPWNKRTEELYLFQRKCSECRVQKEELKKYCYQVHDYCQKGRSSLCGARYLPWSGYKLCDFLKVAPSMTACV